MERRLLVINEKDNVGVLLESAFKGDTCTHAGEPVEIVEDIEFAHKVALTDIPKGLPVVKYGEDIGHALQDIGKGEWVHVHNMGCSRGK